MFELGVQREFCAAHAIVMAGRRETSHGHNWRVTLVVRGEQLDADGLLCDFHEVEKILDRVLAPLRDANLNETPPFDALNPTAEHVAKHIADAVSAQMQGPARVHRVTVTEAPGCAATCIVEE